MHQVGVRRRACWRPFQRLPRLSLASTPGASGRKWESRDVSRCECSVARLPAYGVGVMRRVCAYPFPAFAGALASGLPGANWESGNVSRCGYSSPDSQLTGVGGRRPVCAYPFQRSPGRPRQASRCRVGIRRRVALRGFVARFPAHGGGSQETCLRIPVSVFAGAPA